MAPRAHRNLMHAFEAFAPSSPDPPAGTCHCSILEWNNRRYDQRMIGFCTGVIKIQGLRHAVPRTVTCSRLPALACSRACSAARKRPPTARVTAPSGGHQHLVPPGGRSFHWIPVYGTSTAALNTHGYDRHGTPSHPSRPLARQVTVSDETGE